MLALRSPQKLLRLFGERPEIFTVVLRPRAAGNFKNRAQRIYFYFLGQYQTKLASCVAVYEPSLASFATNSE